jgi:hypothetical protein
MSSIGICFIGNWRNPTRTSVTSFRWRRCALASSGSALAEQFANSFGRRYVSLRVHLKTKLISTNCLDDDKSAGTVLQNSPPESPPPDEPTTSAIDDAPANLGVTVANEPVFIVTNDTDLNERSSSSELTSTLPPTDLSITVSTEVMTLTGSGGFKRRLDAASLPERKSRPGRPAKTRALDFYKFSAKPFSKKKESEQSRGITKSPKQLTL